MDAFQNEQWEIHNHLMPATRKGWASTRTLIGTPTVNYNPNNGNCREEKGIEIRNPQSICRIQARMYHTQGSPN